MGEKGDKINHYDDMEELMEAKAGYAKRKSALMMVSGTVLSMSAFGLIVIPQGYASGGITGLCRILSGLIPLHLSTLLFIANLLLLVAGWIFMGSAFAVKTIAVSVLSPALLELFLQLPPLGIARYPLVGIILAGVMVGGGTGLVLRSGASCGGFDVVAAILNRKWGVSISAVLRVSDCVVILIQAFRGTLMQTLYGICTFSICAAVAGRVAKKT